MDPIFLAYASFGVFVFGISKGGVPGPIAMLAVPVMSFAMSPLQAAGILLPLWKDQKQILQKKHKLKKLDPLFKSL